MPNIKLEHNRSLKKVERSDLVLWKCTIPADDNLEKALDIIRFDGTDKRLRRLSPTSKISEIFETVLPVDTIHVLVEVPVLGDSNQNILESLRTKRLRRHLPSLEELPGALDEPLLDFEKIPISNTIYTGLTSDGYFFCFIGAVQTPAPAGGTVKLFHSLWDYFLLNGICPFRGQEGTEEPENPKAKLAQKFNWVYDPAPYMLGE
ncbi:hypothetical protein H0H81_001999 [Sphagnurus paluster]|uniref:Crinkler effector protein N-terminal domain-containing protein n=1 Tax=Sphagnurus paluster TaxID=117069 RepID=A0A9P7GUG2_9AGAR|nr:hypothetical protein H0H81_001999 [Sphagnurus paluster]